MSSCSLQKTPWHACQDEASSLSCSEGVNCYSYALRRPDLHWSVPGYGFAHEQRQSYRDRFRATFNDFSLNTFRSALIQGAKRDGLIEISYLENHPKEHVVALVFPTTIRDFHWYRREEDGRWSHKNGWRDVSFVDEIGAEILEPREAVSSSYPLFGGFFLVPNTGVNIISPFPTV